jgi:hypothetical protein
MDKPAVARPQAPREFSHEDFLKEYSYQAKPVPIAPQVRFEKLPFIHS